jgi:ribosome-binding protein aMBF1 (putative translation factor)
MVCGTRGENDVIPICRDCLHLTREERQEMRNARRRCRVCKKTIRPAKRIYLKNGYVKNVCKTCAELPPEQRRWVRFQAKKSRKRRSRQSAKPCKKSTTRRSPLYYAALMTPMEKDAHRQQIQMAMENREASGYTVTKLPPKRTPKRGRRVRFKRQKSGRRGIMK